MSADSRTPSADAASAPDALEHRFASAGLDWIVPRWPAPPRVQAFMTTRNGGVSTGASASLDLGGASSAETAEANAVAENRRRVEAFLPAAPAWLRQVHGSAVVDFARDRASPPWPEADAAVTHDAGIVLVVRVADCLPVLLAERDGDGAAIAVAHAGWRGLAAGVVDKAVRAMRCDPSRIVAWLGPAIGRTAFEVGADVRDTFVECDRDAASAFVAGRPGKWYADLEALARMRLARSGVASVHGGGMCTASHPGRFFSWRRDRAAGRMGAFLWRT